MPAHAISILGHRLGNPAGHGAPSHVYRIAAWIDCPENMKARLPVQVQLRDQTLTSRATTAVPDATDEEKTAVAAGDVIEFVVDEAGGQHGDHLTADELEADLLAVWEKLSDAVTDLAAQYTDPKAGLLGKRLGLDGKFVGLDQAARLAIDRRAVVAKADLATARAADLATAAARASTDVGRASAAKQAGKATQADVDAVTAEAVALEADAADAESAASEARAAAGVPLKGQVKLGR
jgi:hypothetical protein